MCRHPSWILTFQTLITHFYHLFQTRTTVIYFYKELCSRTISNHASAIQYGESFVYSKETAHSVPMWKLSINIGDITINHHVSFQLSGANWLCRRCFCLSEQLRVISHDIMLVERLNLVWLPHEHVQTCARIIQHHRK